MSAHFCVFIFPRCRPHNFPHTPAQKRVPSLRNNQYFNESDYKYFFRFMVGKQMALFGFIFVPIPSQLKKIPSLRSLQPSRSHFLSPCAFIFAVLYSFLLYFSRLSFFNHRSLQPLFSYLPRPMPHIIYVSLNREGQFGGCFPGQKNHLKYQDNFSSYLKCSWCGNQVSGMSNFDKVNPQSFSLVVHPKRGLWALRTEGEA